MKRLVPGTNYDARDVPVWRIYVFGFEHLWFLQSIFIVFLIVGILDALGLLVSQLRWFIATGVSAILDLVDYSCRPNDDFFTSAVHSGCFPSSCSATDCVDIRSLIYAVLRWWSRSSLSPVCTSQSGCSPFSACTTQSQHVDKLIGIAVGVLAVVLIYSARNVLNTRVLAWVGGFSFGIYLLHVFATAGTRIVLEHLGLHVTWELFFICWPMGIAGPIAFQLAFRNVGFVQTFVLGERRRHRKVLEG